MTEISKNILLISGSGRNVGKTSFILEVIAKNASRNLAAIKITPHFHDPTEGLVPISVTENYRIYQETDCASSKDSSLFLQAGAKKVFFIQSKDFYLEEAFQLTLKKLLPDQPIMVESAALRKIIIPGLYLFIQKNEEVKSSALEMQKFADTTIFSDGTQFSLNPKSILYTQIWKTKTNDIT